MVIKTRKKLKPYHHECKDNYIPVQRLTCNLPHQSVPEGEGGVCTREMDHHINNGRFHRQALN